MMVKFKPIYVYPEFFWFFCFCQLWQRFIISYGYSVWIVKRRDAFVRTCGVFVGAIPYLF